MNDKSRIEQLISSVTDWLGEQSWFQQIKSKWEELDTQSRLYLQFSAAGAGFLLVAFFVVSFMWGVHSLKKEVDNRSELLSTIQSANDELKGLQVSNKSLIVPPPNPNANGKDATPPAENWPGYLETVAGSYGVGKSNVSVSDTKAGASNDVSKESLIDVTLKKVNIKQAIRFAQGLESGTKPVKIRGMKIETAPDGTGYIDVTLSLSTFVLVQK